MCRVDGVRSVYAFYDSGLLAFRVVDSYNTRDRSPMTFAGVAIFSAARAERQERHQIIGTSHDQRKPQASICPHTPRIMAKKMETTIGCRDSGKENRNYYIITGYVLGLYTHIYIYIYPHYTKYTIMYHSIL